MNLAELDWKIALHEHMISCDKRIADDENCSPIQTLFDASLAEVTGFAMGEIMLYNEDFYQFQEVVPAWGAETAEFFVLLYYLDGPATITYSGPPPENNDPNIIFPSIIELDIDFPAGWGYLGAEHDPDTDTMRIVGRAFETMKWVVDPNAAQ